MQGIEKTESPVRGERKRASRPGGLETKWEVFQATLPIAMKMSVWNEDWKFITRWLLGGESAYKQLFQGVLL